jgi:hypothetical protein
VTVEPRELAGGAVRAARWSSHLPANERRRAVKTWLACRLSGQGREDVLRTLEGLRDLFEAEREAGEAPPEPVQLAGAVAPLLAFAREYYGDEWSPTGSTAEDAERAQQALEELAAGVRALASDQGGVPGEGLREVLGRLSARLAATDAAVKKAAQEAFDRLLQSVSPAFIEAQAGGKGMKVGPFHKAGLYEAWSQKFGQLQDYHRAGRLVGDFRASYRRHVQRELERKEAQ